VSRRHLYTRYERIWHWSQAVGILLLLATGMQMHYPGSLGPMGLQTAAAVHNLLGFVLIANAFLSLFYHLTTGEIRQYVSRSPDVITLALRQARYYAVGIFRGEPHPFDRSRQERLNPIQKGTYVLILNVLLPLQVVTGVLIWSAQRWPEAAGAFVGLRTVLAVHTLGAWLFAAFLVVHVYMTTTGHTPLAHIRSMITGYEDEQEARS